MKKALPVLLFIVCLITVLVFFRIHKAEPPSKVSPGSFADVPTGESITFEVKYRGVSGRSDDIRPYSYSGYGMVNDCQSAFVDAVKERVQNDFVIVTNPYLNQTERGFSVLEYSGSQALALYYDLNEDGKLLDDERMEPVQRDSQNNPTQYVFVTPDIDYTTQAGDQIPFRLWLQANFYAEPSQPSVMWSTAGLYEGEVKIEGQKKRFYLFPSLYSQGYMTFGQSYYSIVPASDQRRDYVPRQPLSSLIVNNKTFYRVKVQPSEKDNQTLIVSLAEDKSPRGKFAFKIQGQDTFQYTLNSLTIQGAKDNGIYFSITRGMDELPIGQYVASYGYIDYNQDSQRQGGYATSFRDIPEFSIEANQTTTVELGKPKATVQAVEYTQRNRSDKQYKEAFIEGTDLYIDVVFTGLAGETYSSFTQLVKKENYFTQDNLKAHIKILDDQNNEIVNQELEYG